MQILNFGNLKKDGQTFTLFDVRRIEFSNPIQELYKQITFNSIDWDLRMFEFNKDKFDVLKGLNNRTELIEQVIEKNAIKSWKVKYNLVLSQKLPQNLLNILECNNKSEQCRILKDLKLTQDEFILLSFKAWEDFGFTYSFYRFEYLPKGINLNQLPQLAYKEEENNEVTIIGKTNLSKGQLKQVIEQRRVMVAKFLDKGDIWHCFFYTYKSLDGMESSGVSHMHYVSNTWNFTREEALSKLKEKYYPFSSVPHIEYRRS